MKTSTYIAIIMVENFAWAAAYVKGNDYNKGREILFRS